MLNNLIASEENFIKKNIKPLWEKNNKTTLKRDKDKDSRCKEQREKLNNAKDFKSKKNKEWKYNLEEIWWINSQKKIN